MNKSYINRVKHKIFPDIKDWRNPQNNFRYELDVRKLSQKQWFWLHPSAYQLIAYGSPIITIIIMAAATFMLIYNDVMALAIIPLIIMLVAIRDLIKKINNEHLHKNTTMYDIYMRE